MTTRVVHRPARVVRPVAQEDPLVVAPPPTLPDGKGIAGVFVLLPIAGSTASLTLMMFFRGSGFAALGAVMMVVVLLATAVMYLSQRGQAARNRRLHRLRYLDHLEQLRGDLAAHQAAQRCAAWQVDPPPASLPDLVRDPARLWERRRRDADFLRVRAGIGSVPARELTLSDQSTPTAPADPFLLAEARMLVDRFGTAPDQPLLVPLDRAGDVSVIGSREDVLAMVVVLVSQVAALHAPEDVAIAACYAEESDWSWLRWLPHVEALAPDHAALCALLSDDLALRATRAAQARLRDVAVSHRRLLVICDCHGHDAVPLPLPDNASALGVTVIHLVASRTAEPSEVSVRLTVQKGSMTVDLADGVLRGEADTLSVELAEGLARTLAPLRLSQDSYDDGSGTPPADFTDLIAAHQQSERDFLRVPIGVDNLGKPVLLDLKESAQLGMGPHGLCVGATGSGKSELLRTLVLGLAATHSPADLNLVMIDYKGGATFAPLASLPHVTGLITNLADDPGLVSRVHASLAGEVQRRQRVLADAGKVPDIATYRLLDDVPSLPYLLVIIDEFGELLTAEPEIIELFLTIGRIGRSIGVHLLLASQRLEAGKIRQLDTHLSYRLGLRTLSEAESRTVLDTADAFHLPPLPGLGYLKVDSSVYTRFKTAYVSGPLQSEERAEPVRQRPAIAPVYTPPAVEVTDDRKASARTTGPTLLSTTVSGITGERALPLWLPPLPDAIALDRAAGGIQATTDGLRLGRADGLRIPIGLLDDPAKQWQDTWFVDLAAAGGHVVVLGGPQSGKTTFLRTLVLGIAATRTPQELAVYGVDLAGTGLRALEKLPHVGGIAGRDSTERLRRTLEEVAGMLDERDAVLRKHRIDGIAELRLAHAAGLVPELPAADVVLVIDGYGQLSGDYEKYEPLVHSVLARGGTHGIHLVTTARRFGEVRIAQQAAFGTRIELRLAEPGESGVDGKLARALPDRRPGRALTTDRLYGQIALPRIDSLPDRSSEGLVQAVRAIRSSWVGPSAPAVRLLPGVLPLASLPDSGAGVPFGVEESTLAPSSLDLFGRDQHMLVLGDSGCGKTNLLRVLAEGIARRGTPDDLVFAVFDPRRGLADAIPDALLGGYAPNSVLAAQLAGAVAKELSERAAAGRSGPRVVLLIDDYDVLTAAGTAPLSPLLPYVSSGRDVGLHVVMTRRVLGAARGMYEQFTAAVRESGCASLLMSGDRSEGQLFPGVRPSVLPVGRGLLLRHGDPVRTVQTAHALEVVA